MRVLGLCFDPTSAGVGHHHDLGLVGVSFIVAALAAYSSLDMAERLRASAGRAQTVWLALSGLMLGAGIWSMHFIGMTAFEAPLPLSFDHGLTLLSGALAVAGCIAGLAILRVRFTPLRLLAAGAVVGLAVAVMHYVGMAALQFSGEVRYRPGVFGLSVVIALTAASAALWFAFSVRSGAQRILAAGAMAVAVCGMHYTAMSGTILVALPGPAEPFAAAQDDFLSTAVTLGVLGLVIASSLLAFLDRRIQSKAELEAARLRALNAELAAAREAAEASVRSQTRFLATMSHEIRTPMNGVLGLLEGVLRTPLSPDQRSDIAIARDSAVNLLRILNDILDYSKLEAGQLLIERVAVSPARLLEDAVSMHAASAAAKGVVLSGRIDPALPAWIEADGLRIRQVLDNLISNAVKFTSAGSVDIEVSSRPGEPGWLRVEVRDTGPGVDAATQARLFQRFVQADASTTRRFGGAGLGLAICKELVSCMGGQIGLRSEPGAGSTFWFEMPAPPASAPATLDAAAVDSASVRPLRILVAEDNAINQRVIAKLLEPWRHELTFVENGEEAVDRAASATYDAILMDIHMPRMDGVEAALRVRRLPAPHGRTPIVAVTANAMAGDRERYLEAGMNDYVAKPIELAALLTVLDRLTGCGAGAAVPRPSLPAAPPAVDLDDVLAILDLSADQPGGVGGPQSRAA